MQSAISFLQFQTSYREAVCVRIPNGVQQSLHEDGVVRTRDGLLIENDLVVSALHDGLFELHRIGDEGILLLRLLRNLL